MLSCHRSNKKGQLSGKILGGDEYQWSFEEEFNGIIRALHTQHGRRKEAEAPVNTDQGLIHTYEIVPVVQFQREKAYGRAKKKK